MWHDDLRGSPAFSPPTPYVRQMFSPTLHKEHIMDSSLNALPDSFSRPRKQHVNALQPLRWLARGWNDFAANPGPSLAHGLILVAMGWLILLMCSTQIDLFAAAVSGFLLVGPVVAAGFYELSRLRASGRPATFDASLTGALTNLNSLAALGGLLAILALAWVLTSRLLFVQVLGGMLPAVGDNLHRTILDWQYHDFMVTYVATGAVFAVIAFFVSAFSAPMIFAGAARTTSAILISIKVVSANPLAMIVWAALIAGLTALGFATFLLGLVVILPVLGHATWHAYRDLTD
jgi:uncharacterized membrane protein